jgi:long-chain acyl-CoA synthetase
VTGLSRPEAVALLTGPGGPFEVVEASVRGIPMRVYAAGPASMRAIFEQTLDYGEREFLVYREERYSYAEHARIVTGLARWLAEGHGVQRGDRVAIGMRNYPEWLFSFWAVQVLGAVAVPLNAWWTGPELRYALADSGTTVAIVDGERLDRLADHLAGLELRAVVVVRPTAEVPDGVERWDRVLATIDRSGRPPPAQVDPDDDATILYTSGTTGRPKGAVGTQRNHVTNHLNTALLGAVGRLMATGSPEPAADATQPCTLQTFPFFHIGGLTGLYTATGFGAKVVLQYKWDLTEALELIQRERIMTLSAVPTIVRQVLESPLLDQYDTSSLVGMTSGGAPVPPDLIGRIDRHFASKVSPANGYGLTETTSAVVVNAGADYVARPTSVGRPVVVADVRVVDPATGSDVPTGEVGELWFRGPNIVRGYWNDPEATAQSFTDGWFHTGDLGHLDAEGFVFVVDRLKDVVIRGGENVYCAEVEAVLFEHPAVADVAIVGIPHPSLGEEVAAVVQVRNGATVTAGELQAHVADRLARFKVPSVVVLSRDALPRTATGKVLKRQLRDQVTGSASGAG